MASTPRTISCPGCQSPVPLPSRVSAGLIVQCRVCGQQSRLEAAPDDGVPPSPPRPAPRRAPLAPPPPVPPPPLPPSGSGRILVIGLLAVALLAGIGIGTVQRFRRGANEPAAKPEAPGTTISNSNGGGSGSSASPDRTNSEPPVSGSVPETPTAAAPLDGLAGNALGVFRKHCHRCHGDGGSDEGGFNFVLNRSRLVEADGFVVPGNPAESRLYKRMQSGEMPPDGDGQKLSPEELATVKAWIEAGAPEFLAKVDRPIVSLEQMFEFIRKDLLEQTPEQDRRFVRYFTLTHLANAGLSDDEMETFRLALSKLLNSLSWNRQIVTLKTLDPGRTVVRVDLRDLEWTDEIWRKVIKADPYGIVHTLAAAKLCQEATECSVPSVRGDWFVFAASQPPLYYDILQLPPDKPMQELERQLRLDVHRNIERRVVARAAFSRSGVSSNNRLIERHRSPYGALWVSYDFAKSTDRGNLFDHPTGPGTDARHFQHDGGEVIFNLPNGLQGYLLIDASGKRLDKGPTSIVSDPHRPDRAVVNGLSCMSCHYAGIIAKADEVRAHVEANRNAFPDATEILNLYPPKADMARLQEEDAKRFSEAAKQVGLTRLTATGEPVVNMALRFESDLDLKLASAELGMTSEAFVAGLDKAPAVARVLGPLKVPGGTIKRDVFVKQFSAAAKAFQLGVIFQETEAGTPEVAQNGPDATKPAPPKPETPPKPEPPPPTTVETPAKPPTPQPPANGNRPNETPQFTARPLQKTGIIRRWADRAGRPVAFGELMGVEEGKTVVILKENGGYAYLDIDVLPDQDVRFIFDVVSNSYPLDLPGYVSEELYGDPQGNPGGNPSGPPGRPRPIGRPPANVPNGDPRGRPLPADPRGAPPRNTPPANPPAGSPSPTNGFPADLPMGERP